MDARPGHRIDAAKQQPGQGGRAHGRALGRARGLAHVRAGAGALRAADGRPCLRPAHTRDLANSSTRAMRAASSRCTGATMERRHGAGALELLGIPYTGSGVMASSIAMDKVMTKRVWRPKDCPRRGSGCRRAPEPAKRMRRARRPLPLIVKPARGLVHRRDQGAGCGHADGRGGAGRATTRVLCEQFIAGDEVTCPVLGTGATDARRCR